MKRNIVSIDPEKCNGCGECVPSCAEGAIKIVNGKAVLSADNLCDGLGACLGTCPMDAITIIERDAAEFDEAAVEENFAKSGKPVETQHHHNSHGGGGCPGSRTMTLTPKLQPAETEQKEGSNQSQLGQWPVQLTLVPPTAPYFQDADLLITADCVPVAYADYHRDFLTGKAVVMGCPKQPDAGEAYVRKLTDIFRLSSIKSITVLAMEVPCCGGIVTAAKQALAASGKDIPLKVVTVGIRGEIK
ncbi:MAG: 4Fe-4S binding protein [Geobacteraceae bacterium]